MKIFARLLIAFAILVAMSFLLALILPSPYNAIAGGVVGCIVGWFYGRRIYNWVFEE